MADFLEVADASPDNVANIVVVGVGGSGNNAVNRMIDVGIDGVNFIAMNTDLKALKATRCDERVQLGEKLCKGLGAGHNPDIGREAAEEAADKIRELLEGHDMVFVTAGMGAGTGTGASPVVARIAKECGCLTVGVVNTPYSYEPIPSQIRAAKGVEELKQNVDALIVFSNDCIYATDGGKGGKDLFTVSWAQANDVLRQAVAGITDIIVKLGDIDRDFADVCMVLKDAGMAHIAVGTGTGDDRALMAIKNAVESPLFNTDIKSAKKVLLNIVGPVTGDDFHAIMSYVTNLTGDETEIVHGVRVEKDREDIEVTIVATGMDVDPNTGSISRSDLDRALYEGNTGRFSPIQGVGRNYPGVGNRSRMPAAGMPVNNYGVQAGGVQEAAEGQDFGSTGPMPDNANFGNTAPQPRFSSDIGTSNLTRVTGNLNQGAPYNTMARQGMTGQMPNMSRMNNTSNLGNTGRLGNTGALGTLRSGRTLSSAGDNDDRIPSFMRKRKDN